MKRKAMNNKTDELITALPESEKAAGNMNVLSNSNSAIQKFIPSHPISTLQ